MLNVSCSWNSTGQGNGGLGLKYRPTIGLGCTVGVFVHLVVDYLYRTQ